MSDLVFPDTGLTPGDVYERWQWNGRAWDPLPQTPYVPLAGNVAMTGPIYYTGPFVLGTTLVNKDYVDVAVSQLQVFAGAWDVAGNDPDLTLVAVPSNGTYYIASSAGTAPAALPGIGGATVRPGDMITWNSAIMEWQIIPGAGMTQAEADVRYLQLAGGTLTGTLTLNGNAAAAPGGNLQPVPLQQLNAALADYVQKAGDTMTGALAVTGANSVVSIGTPTGAAVAGPGNLNIQGAYYQNGVSIGTGPFLPLIGGALAGPGNFSVAGTSTLTGNTTVGGTLGVTGLSTLAALTSTAATNLSTTSGAVTVGSATNNATFTARGIVALSSITGNTTVGGAAVPANMGTLFVTANHANSSAAVFEQRNANSFNQGIRVNRASSTSQQTGQWGGVLLGGPQSSAVGADASGDGAFTPDPVAGAITGNRVNARATWWVSSNPQGDFVIDQSGSAQRNANLTNAQNVVAATEPSGSTGFYIRRSDNQAYVNGYKIGHTRWRNYINQVTLVPGLTWYQGGSSYIIADDSEVRMQGLINYTTAFQFLAGNHANMFVLPVGLRLPPGISSYYPPATIFSTGSGVGANSRLFAAYMGVANNGQVTIVAQTDVITYNTNGGYIMFNISWFVRAVPNA